MSEDGAELGGQVWQQAIDNNGRLYWYHMHTRYSTWDNPYETDKFNMENLGQYAPDERSNVDYNEYDDQGRERTQSMSTVSDFENLPFPEYQRDSIRLSTEDGRIRRQSLSAPVFNPNSKIESGPTSGDYSPNKQAVENSKTNPSDVWVECQEVVSGRTLYYHRETQRILFDSMPTDNLSAISETPLNSMALSNFPHSRKGFSAIDVAPRNQSQSLSSIKLPYVPSDRKKSYAMLVPDATSQLNSLDIVTQLLETKSLPWNFNNPVAIYYRCNAKLLSRLNEEIPPPQAIMYPRYFSNVAIPTPRHIVCTVKIPECTTNGISYTKIHCNPTDSANDMVWKALKKCDGKAYEPEKCILKAIGTEEYVYGTANVLDFEYIRTCISNHVEIRFSLMYIEDIEKRVREADEEMRNDEEMVCYPDDIPLVPIYSDEDYEQANSTELSSVVHLRVLPLDQINIPLKFHICDLENVQICPRFDNLIYAVCVEIKIMLGASTVANTVIRTRFRRPREGLLFLQDVILPSIDLNSLPLASVLVFSVFGVKLEQKEVLLAYVKQPLIEYNNCLVSGSRSLPMWIVPNEDKDFDHVTMARATNRPNLSSLDAPTLNVKFPSYLVPIMSKPLRLQMEQKSQLSASIAPNFSSKVRAKLDQIVSKDALGELDDEEKELLWMARYNYVDDPGVLPKLLRCVDWFSVQQRSEAYYLLSIWAKPIHPLHALALLDVHYADPCVREYAVQILEELSDSDLQQVLLQLVQVLKFDVNHDSPMARFLLRRGANNPYQIGHFLFWHLKAELHNADYCERFALILETYIVHFKKHARELYAQDRMIKELQQIAQKIAHLKNRELTSDTECKSILKESLTRLNESFPERWQIPLNPKWQVRSLKPPSCKYMSSKKVPLWLCFVNCDQDAEDIQVIFKTGDDLRQDLLTLQLFRVMDRTWLREGRDMALKPYTCVATGVTNEGEGVGMIEVVGESATISHIQSEEGGGALGAFKNNTLVKWLQKHNRGGGEYGSAVDNFMRSCAGYCVATFCLGIGDRHNDNIMLTKDGHLFHIDFGHFLGNFKSKYGFKRERAPFVFTPEMAQVMGGLKSKEYKEFVTLCCHAFNLLRKEATLFITLFNLMIAAGMPELRSCEDIHYLRDRLLLTLTDDAASKAFKKEIKKTISDFYRRVDNSIHILKHG